jgi:hypothetical protein
LVNGDFGTPREAFDAAELFVESRRSKCGIGPLATIGEFVIPPLDGPASRDFQTLHIDFGLPLDPKIPQDVARFTALHVPHGLRDVTAVTRLVPLGQLLAQRDWPEYAELLARVVAYGRTHGSRDDHAGYSEGSLARVVDAASSIRPLLASVKVEPDFLCGTEFDTSGAERAFFLRHGLDVDGVEIDVVLQPGQLLVFDNLAFAHGRRGKRQPGELHQRIFGHRQLSPAGQSVIRDRVLSAFYPSSTNESTVPRPTAASLVSIP